MEFNRILLNKIVFILILKKVWNRNDLLKFPIICVLLKKI